MKNRLLIFKDTDSIEVEKDGGKGKEQGLIVSDKTEVTIENAIWDGQSLLDFESLALLPGNSVFQDNRCPGKALHQKGMVLLRNRFFKSCAFNTNLQQWFADNGVTDVKDLAGYTRAKRIKDILLVVKEEQNLLEKIAKGLLDGRVGPDFETSGGSTVWKVIKDGVPRMFKEGPGGKIFNGKENESFSGAVHLLQEWKSKEEILEFLRKFGWLMSDPDVKAYSAKFKPKK